MLLATQNIYIDNVFSAQALYYCEEGEETVAYGACYDADGRFLDVVTMPLTPGEFNELDVERGNAKIIRFFALNGDGIPLCTAFDAPALQ